MSKKSMRWHCPKSQCEFHCLCDFPVVQAAGDSKGFGYRMEGFWKEVHSTLDGSTKKISTKNLSSTSPPVRKLRKVASFTNFAVEPTGSINGEASS